MALSPASLFSDDVMHFVLSGIALLLFVISVTVLRKIRTWRYSLLALAFAFFALDQLVQLLQQLYYGSAELMIPVLDLHVTHFFELLMSVSFVAALLYPAGPRRVPISP